MNANIFEQAARQKLRIATVAGSLSVEELFDLPLQHARSINLDDLGRSLRSQLRSAGEDGESLVTAATPKKENEGLALQFEIVKHIIGVKVAEKVAADSRAAARAKRDKLVEALGRAQDREIDALTPDQIREQLAAIGD